MPVRAIREQAPFCHYLMFVIKNEKWLKKGSKYTKLLGMEGDTITLRDIFTYRLRVLIVTEGEGILHQQVYDLIA